MTTRILFLLKWLVTPLVVMGQGTVYFSNYVPMQGVDAPIYIVYGENACARVEGSGFLAQLYAGPNLGSLSPVGLPAPFLTGSLAGYFDGGTDPLRVIPSVLPGFPAFGEVRAWQASDGATWEEAFSKCGLPGVICAGRSNPFLMETGSNPSAPGYLVHLSSFQFGASYVCIPEPSTLVLLFSGAVILAVRLRRR